jgi:hypothetical protein
MFNPKNEQVLSKFSNGNSWESNNSASANIHGFMENIQSSHAHEMITFSSYEALISQSEELDEDRNVWLSEKLLDIKWKTDDSLSASEKESDKNHPLRSKTIALNCDVLHLTCGHKRIYEENGRTSDGVSADISI